MRYLIENGADVLAKDYKDTTTLHFVVNDPLCVTIAIEHGCNIHSFDQLCRIPYHSAALLELKKGHDKVMEILENTPGIKVETVDI